MAPEAANAQRDDGRETDGLEEQGQHEHGEACVLPLGDGRAVEDDDAGEVEAEDPAGLHEFHQEGAAEAADCEATLGAG